VIEIVNFIGLFRLSRLKTEHLHCRFSTDEGGIASKVAIEGAIIPRVERFRYLGSIIQGNGEIDEDINHQIKVGWQKWKNASGVLCDRRIPLRLKVEYIVWLLDRLYYTGRSVGPSKSRTFKG